MVWEIGGFVFSGHDGEMDDAERRIVRDLYLPLRRFAAVVGPPEVDPDDLVQEAFLRVLRRGSLASLEAPLPYCRRTILNLASNHRRWLGRRNRAVSRLALSDADQVTANYPSDLADLQALSQEDRAILYLADVEAYTFAEIADIVGRSEAFARQRASRARRRLKQVLTKEARQ